MVSGSSPDNAHALKGVVVDAGLVAAGLAPGDGSTDPLAAVAAIGDPMQPLVAGIAIAAAAAGSDVLLAGGSQMLAVAALVKAIAASDALERMVVGTTRWVAHDPAAAVPALATLVHADLPVLAANLDFSRSRHLALRPYEQFLVKEGVGAGGTSIAKLVLPQALGNAADT